MKSLSQIDGELKNHWYILCLSNELPARKPMRRVVYDVPYVVFRDSRGEVRAFVDRCLHRGAQLSEGRLVGDRLQCPYHGWAYDTQGVVAEVPSDGPEAVTAKKRCWALKSAALHEQDGCIWIWMGSEEKRAESPTPSWRFPYHKNSKWSQYFMITNFANEVTALVQNFMDVPHTVFVHDKWFRRRRALKVPVHIHVGDGRVKVDYQQGSDSIGFIGRILNPRNHPMVHTDEFIFPNITRVDYTFGNFGFVINSQCTPVSRYETRVYTWIAYRVGILSSILKPFFRFYTRQVIEQDVQIMLNHGRNLSHFEAHQEEPALAEVSVEKSTPADELHLAIDRLRRQGVENPQASHDVHYERTREFWI